MRSTNPNWSALANPLYLALIAVDFSLVSSVERLVRRDNDFLQIDDETL
jgi:hypothetical protein